MIAMRSGCSLVHKLPLFTGILDLVHQIWIAAIAGLSTGLKTPINPKVSIVKATESELEGSYSTRHMMIPDTDGVASM